jgi:hypothetical protein
MQTGNLTKTTTPTEPLRLGTDEVTIRASSAETDGALLGSSSRGLCRRRGPSRRSRLAAGVGDLLDRPAEQLPVEAGGAAPSGSVITDMRPTSITSNGSATTPAPSSRALAVAASADLTVT